MALDAIHSADLLRVFDDMAAEISRSREYLTELDSVGGDGDHGVNLERGFLEVRKKLGELGGKDIGSIFTSVGSTLLSTVGGSTGSLYGATLIKVGNACRGKTEITAKDISKLFQESEKALTSLGGAKPGDKTMLDVLHPAGEAASKAAEETSDLVRISAQAARAARAGLESTKSMVAKKGRAMYLGERTLGHYDAGAASLCLIVESCAKTLSEF